MEDEFSCQIKMEKVGFCGQQALKMSLCLLPNNDTIKEMGQIY
jgi:hypothetical protein